MNHIVIGFGSHESNTHTLEWAARFASRADARLTVLNVFHRAYIEMSPTTHDRLLEERRELIVSTVSRAGHGDLEIAVAEGEPVEELLRFSTNAGADLIVVGHTETMAPGGFGQHGAAEELLNHSQIPFVVVGEKAPLPAIGGPLTMVVGVDGSTANADSVASIADIATDVGARVVPVLSVNTGASTTRANYGSHLLHQDEAEAIAARLPGDEELWLLNEAPVQGLIEAADEVDACCIAIGTRGHRSLSDLLAGQLSRRVIEHAERAVLIAPHL
jgi:nucleotide-binding universal stress UspA family protein